MPRVLWPLQHGRPCVQVVLTLAQGSQPLPRTLLADTGAGFHPDGPRFLQPKGVWRLAA